MNRSALPGGALCAVILDDGTDCGNAVHEEAPLNLCVPHLIEAAAWVNANDESRRPRSLCVVCGEREVRVDPNGGGVCGRCGYQTPDFAGSATLTPAEEDETNPRGSRIRSVNVVYYVRFGDRIKIGTSMNARQRLQAIPHDEVLGFELGGIHVEAARHEQFRAHRVGTSEWFHVSDELLAHIATLTPDGSNPWDTFRQLVTRHAVKRI